MASVYFFDQAEGGWALVTTREEGAIPTTLIDTGEQEVTLCTYKTSEEAEVGHKKYCALIPEGKNAFSWIPTFFPAWEQKKKVLETCALEKLRQDFKEYQGVTETTKLVGEDWYTLYERVLEVKNGLTKVVKEAKLHPAAEKYFCASESYLTFLTEVEEAYRQQVKKAKSELRKFTNLEIRVLFPLEPLAAEILRERQVFGLA